MAPQRAAVVACLLIVGLDWIQPLVFDWVPKHVGALVGGVLYLIGAVGLARGVRPVAIVIALMPVIPLTTLALSGLGVPLPVSPDAPMLVVLSAQLVAAAAAGAWWSATQPPRREDRTT